LVSVEQDGTESVALLQVDPCAFGSTLRDLAADDYELEVEEPGGFSCAVVWRHEPLCLELAYRTEFYEFEQSLVDITNYIIVLIGQLIQPPTFVLAGRGVNPAASIAFKSAATAILVERSRPQSASPKWSLKTTAWSLGQVQAEPTEIFRRVMPLHSTSALCSLGHSWLKGEAKVRGEALAQAHSMELAPAPVDSKPTRHPDYATLLGEKEDWQRGRQKAAPLAEALHTYVSQKLSERLFPRHGYHVKHDLLEDAQPKHATALPFSPENGLPAVTARSTVSGLVVSSISSRSDREPDDGTGVHAVLPVLVALHSGFTYLEQPALHLDVKKRIELADIILERVNMTPATIIVEASDPSFIGHLLRGLLRSSEHGGCFGSPKLYCDQLCVADFRPLRDGTVSASWKTFNERTDHLGEWIKEFLASLK
jgi:hypothetical protein